MKLYSKDLKKVMDDVKKIGNRKDMVAKETGEWFDKLSDKVKIAYLKEHMDSKFATRLSIKNSHYPGNTHLHDLIKRKDGKFLLKHPDVAKVKNGFNETPVHFAAEYHKEALQHPKISKLRTDDGDTPLHYAAPNHLEALNDPNMTKVKNKFGETPLHWCSMYGKRCIKKIARGHPAAKKLKII